MTDCAHDWRDVTRYAILGNLGFERQCKICTIRERWRQTVRPNPFEGQEFMGIWEPAEYGRADPWFWHDLERDNAR